MWARVLLPEPIGLLDYAVPDALVPEVCVGVPVRVPLGKRHSRGYVTEVGTSPPPAGLTLRELLAVDSELPTLPTPLLEVLLFAADYYLALPGELLQSALPPLIRRSAQRYRLTTSGREAAASVSSRDRDLYDFAARLSRPFTAAAAQRALGLGRRATAERMRRLLDAGLLQRQGRPAARLRYGFRRLAGDVERLGRKQRARRLWESLPEGETVRAEELAQSEPRAAALLRQLEQADLVERVAVAAPAAAGPLEVAPIATTAQTAAIAQLTAAIETRRFAPFLLLGVTGSGKTEVYLRAIARGLELGRTALVLVPEIALTPQLAARFRARFGQQVAIFHSGLSPTERRDEWERVAAGRASIGLGARSAIFLPLRDLGVIVVDEEYETSYKQEESPRYHARDLAVVRGAREGAVVILGSATPSLETRTNADAGRYARLDLPMRVHARPLPEVERVSLVDAERVGEGVFTRSLAAAIERTLGADEQIVLFLNRRGFSSYVFCRDCGHSFRCPDCAVSLTWHRRRGDLVCHYCGFSELAPDRCPACLGHRVEGQGLGTERVESEVRALFGDVPVARLDRDTVRRRHDLERVLQRFAAKEARILIGTQMVAKGHDFPEVTLVGVINADAGLNFPDFRAAERTFQLLTQVAGRAGRGDRPGQVIVQAYETEHYAIEAAARHDYEGFIEQELRSRQELDYPPFSHLALLRLESANEAAAASEAETLAARLRELTRRQRLAVKVLGPAPAPLNRLRGVFRVQILLKGKSRSQVRQLLTARGRSVGQVRQILDVDPLSML